MKASLVGIGILGLVALLGFGWLLTGNNLAMQNFFNPKFEAVRRNTFEQSKAYNEGMVQELQNMQFEYIKADKDAKLALRAIILHRSANFNENNLPTDLYEFIQNLKRERANFTTNTTTNPVFNK